VRSRARQARAHRSDSAPSGDDPRHRTDHRLADCGDGGGHQPVQSARQFAAWLGLVPRQHATGGKTRLGRITKAGNKEIRKLLVLGATSMLGRAEGWHSALGAWLRDILQRRPTRLVTVALANKMARIAWAVMTRNEVYRPHGGIAVKA
jgi:transposase